VLHEFTKPPRVRASLRVVSLPQVRVALPWLQSALAAAAANETLPPLDALRWLSGRGQFGVHAPETWREWLLDAVAGAPSLRTTPAGPAVAARFQQPVQASGSWCLAQPVHLAAGLDHLRLAPLGAAALADEDANSLAATVSAHFAGADPQISGWHDGAWLLHFAAATECATYSPELVVGHSVRDCLPSGPHGARVRSLMNEIQMLLHEHPVNAQRERARQLPVNAWWLWGFGAGVPSHFPAAATARLPGVDDWSLVTDDAWLRALWGEEGADRLAADAVTTGAAAPRRHLLIAPTRPPAHEDAESLAAIDSGLLAWLVRQVRDGAIGRLDLLAGDRTLALGRTARLQFWRRPTAAQRWLG
jgi:hypothetical protein